MPVSVTLVSSRSIGPVSRDANASAFGPSFETMTSKFNALSQIAVSAATARSSSTRRTVIGRPDAPGRITSRVEPMPNPHFLCASPYIFLWQLHMTHLPDVPPAVSAYSPAGVGLRTATVAGAGVVGTSSPPSVGAAVTYSTVRTACSRAAWILILPDKRSSEELRARIAHAVVVSTPPVSSGHAHDAVQAGSSRLIGLQSPVDIVAEPAAQGPDRLGLGVASGQTFVNVSMPEARASELAYCDAVQGGIELTVAAKVEPMADNVARPDWDGSRPVVSCKGCLRPEALDAGCLGDDLGGAQRTAAEQIQQ